MRISSPSGCLRTIMSNLPLLLETDREPCGAPPLNARLELRVPLEHFYEALQLGPVRQDVVREDRATGAHLGEDQLEISRVVSLPSVNEHEIERALDRRDQFQRVSAAQLDEGQEAQTREVVRRQVGAARIDLKGDEPTACLAQAEGDPDGRVAIGGADFKPALVAALDDEIVQELTVHTRHVHHSALTDLLDLGPDRRLV